MTVTNRELGISLLVAVALTGSALFAWGAAPALTRSAPGVGINHLV